ncbi:MAG: molecular chaperone HtpG, partial [Lachnospiraceae bacterium]|nr:molecular chaperone HtpG [Lachnospiraceae bacterium]
FCNIYKAREVIKKYCSFMPVEIYLSKANTDETETIDQGEELPTDEIVETIAPKEDDKDKKIRLKIRKRPELLNDTHPLWTKNPSECTREEYLEFYRKVFNDYREPLFWIHLNMDYPFNLKGILYFPKINTEYESIEGTIKLYNNQVFIADNIKEVIPEFLMLLKGVIDCPDLPLNVSRSALQNDGFVNKISDFITKKVADKLSGMCKTEKDEYEKCWDDIAPFIKFGCLKDDKFCEKMTDYILFKNLDGKYMTLPECLEVKPIDTEDEDGETKAEDTEAAAEGQAEHSTESDNLESAEASEDEKKEKVIYYVTDEKQQSQYIEMFKKAKMDAVILNHNIDQPFISQLEAKNEGIKFMRIDADVTDTFKGKTSKKEQEEIEAATENISKVFKKAIKKDKIAIKLEKLKNKKVASMITLSEESRRMQDMMKMYGMGDMGGMEREGETLVLNYNHPLVKRMMEGSGKNEQLICEQLYDLARLQHAPLEAEEMSRFIQRSNELLSMLAE